MAGWDDVRRIALALPETSERPSHGNASWRVRDKLFVWERPLRPADLRAPPRLAREWEANRDLRQEAPDPGRAARERSRGRRGLLPRRPR
jgi:hypothetical protein